MITSPALIGDRRSYELSQDTERSRPRLRRLRRYTWMPNGKLQSNGPWNGTGIAGTQILTVCCPDDFYAVRIGFPNITTSAMTFPKIAVVPSTTWNDGVNPMGGAMPTLLTTVYAGADVNKIVSVSGISNSLTVPGNTTDPSSGYSFIPSWAYTDWTPVQSTTPDPTTGMRVLMIRHTIQQNNGGQMTTTAGALAGFTYDSTGYRSGVTNGYDTFLGGFNNGTDHTAFGTVAPATAAANSVTNGCFVGMVQFMTAHGVIQGMSVGDSHHSGTTTAGGINSFMAKLTTQLGQREVGSVPHGWAAAAFPGTSSNWFLPNAKAILGTVSPAYVILPGWTYNDVTGAVHADAAACAQFFAHLLQFADDVKLSGAVPIWLTPFPRNAADMTATQVAPWLALRQSIMAMASEGEIVVDVTPSLSNVVTGQPDGTYLPGLSTDGIHPNDGGHAIIASLLIPVLQKLKSQS